MTQASLVRLAGFLITAAIVAAVAGFTGLLGAASVIAQLLSFVLLAISTLTLGLSLFVPLPSSHGGSTAHL